MDYVSSRFACHVIDNVIIGVHTTDAPTDEDWTAWLEHTDRALAEFGSIRVLVFSHGGGPSSKQRGEVNGLFKDRPQRVAVMLNSRFVRGVVTALSWFNPEIRAFDLSQFSQACVHLGIVDERLEAVRDAMTEMRSGLSLTG